MTQNGTPVSRAAVYARCSTDEHRQDTENQIQELRRYCEAMGWAYDVVSEYDSGYTGKQEKLQEVLEQIRRGKYQVLVVFSLDRFSRAHPSKVNALLDTIVQRDGCRFISKQEGIDSEQEMIWHCIKPLFSYFAFVFSRNLSEKIKAGIRTKREKGVYRGGRPRKSVDPDRLKALLLTKNGDGWRKLAQRYNEGLRSDQQVSFSLLRKVVQQLQFAHQQPTSSAVKITSASP